MDRCYRVPRLDGAVGKPQKSNTSFLTHPEPPFKIRLKSTPVLFPLSVRNLKPSMHTIPSTPCTSPCCCLLQCVPEGRLVLKVVSISVSMKFSRKPSFKYPIVLDIPQVNKQRHNLLGERATRKYFLDVLFSSRTSFDFGPF